MGVYAHRFIEVLDKDNKWKVLPVWNKHEEDAYGKPDIIIGELKLKKQFVFSKEHRLVSTLQSHFSHRMTSVIPSHLMS